MTAFLHKDEEMVEFTKITHLLEHYTGRMKANVVTFELNAIMHAVLRRAEKLMSCRDLVVTRKFIKP